MLHRALYSVVVLFAATATSFAQDAVELHSVIIEDGNVLVEYSKNFITCAHLYRDSTSSITHIQNLFCPSGDNVLSVNPESSFRILTIGETVRLQHGNNSGGSQRIGNRDKSPGGRCRCR
ncbi:MAG: hypothetical protein HON53_07630 [Planctomycetaceae bacterium]|jgi:hypothetical protein|nr:hypothetical protein [Planctomycetaceae bacterium]MBT6158067.1 hypothetical protein [Planctomycetaceae bacterium]MBT6495816.1 hypothetical protein [Planctomycetaceae bacterium]